MYMSKIEESNMKRCGYIAIVGRPNVGKSTLLNFILGEKISITSSKPQTTRHKILGIKTETDTQAIYVDTPGIYREKTKNSALNKHILKNALSSIFDVDLIVFVIDTKWHDEDEMILKKISQTKLPIILAINKIDKIKNHRELLPYVDTLQHKANFLAIVPISAKNNKNLLNLTKIINSHLPLHQFLFPEDQLTDRSDKFLAAEIIREKLMRHLGQELPYALDVKIEQFEKKTNILHIHALIIIARKSHKPIIIGKNGEKLKIIATKSRQDMEKLFDAKVFLKLWLKIKSNWINDEKILVELGY